MGVKINLGDNLIYLIEDKIEGKYDYSGKIYISESFQNKYKKDAYSIALCAIYLINSKKINKVKFNYYQEFMLNNDSFIILDEVGYVKAMLVEELFPKNNFMS